MLGNGEAQKEAIRPDFNKSIVIILYCLWWSGECLVLSKSKHWTKQSVIS